MEESIPWLSTLGTCGFQISCSTTGAFFLIRLIKAYNNHCQIKVKVSVPGKSPFRKDNVSPLYFVHSFFYGNAIVCMVEVVVVLLIMYIIIYHEFDTKNTFVAVKPLSKKTGLIIYFFTRIVVSNTKLFQAIFIWNVFIVVYLQCRRKVRWDVPDKHCRLKRRLDALRPSWDFQIHLQGSFQTKKSADFLKLPPSEGGHHLVSV